MGVHIVLYFEKPGVPERMGYGGFPNQVFMEFPFSFHLDDFTNFMILRHSSHQVFRPSDDPVHIAMDVFCLLNLPLYSNQGGLEGRGIRLCPTYRYQDISYFYAPAICISNKVILGPAKGPKYFLELGQL